MKRMMAGAMAALALIATPAAAQTRLSGDRIDGLPVVEQLDAVDLAPGQVHRFWFRAGDTALGQGWYVPVIVVRGAQPGKRLLLTAGIHGDELNGIDVIQQLANRIDPARLSGTLVMIPGLNTPGLNNSTRNFTPGGGTGGTNLNRVMPGTDDPTDGLASTYASRLWHRLMRPNADQMIDLHTQSAGTAYVFYAFVSSPEARRIAELIGPDVLRLDPGQRGTVENEMVPAGIPAITLEIGRPEIFDTQMNARTVDGILRVMADMQMIAARDAPRLTGPGLQPFVANRLINVFATRGGWARILVPLNADVREGQEIATISDAFGRVVATQRAPVTGRVASITTDPRVENGDMLVRIGYWSDDPACARGCD
jgi:hypothetical protein